MTASRSGPIAILTAAMLGLIPAETAAEPPVPPGWSSADLAAYGYAVHKAWNCNADVPESQRRAWFQRLKHDYPSTSWAQTLRYYW